MAWFPISEQYKIQQGPNPTAILCHTEQALVATTATAETLCTSVRTALETASGAVHLKGDIQQGPGIRCFPGTGGDEDEAYGQVKEKGGIAQKWKMPEPRDKGVTVQS